MLEIPDIRLATDADAHAIAALSRDAIEHGLGWRYTPDRIRATIHRRTTNVAVVHARGCVLAAGIMEYGDASAHLVLLGVQRSSRRRGLGRQLLGWLEACAITAGLETVGVEVREDNPNALAFYRSQGYRLLHRVPGYYRGMLDAVRLAKALGTTKPVHGDDTLGEDLRAIASRAHEAQSMGVLTRPPGPSTGPA
jgi:ribosomal-protein-alanine N-acetyltransferase